MGFRVQGVGLGVWGLPRQLWESMLRARGEGGKLDPKAFSLTSKAGSKFGRFRVSGAQAHRYEYREYRFYSSKFRTGVRHFWWICECLRPSTTQLTIALKLEAFGSNIHSKEASAMA